MWAAHSQLLQIFGSLHDGYNVAQPYGYQILRDFAISQVEEHTTSCWCSNLLTLARQVTFIATHVKFVLAQLPRINGILPGEYHATPPGEHQMLADNDPRILSQIELPVPKISQLTGIQETGVPASGGTPRKSKFRCTSRGCTKTFKRLQERNRHFSDKHEPRRRCPFCPHEWTRPDKIMTHLRKEHEDKSQVLNEIRDMCGQRLITFLDMQRCCKVSATPLVPVRSAKSCPA